MAVSGHVKFVALHILSIAHFALDWHFCNLALYMTGSITDGGDDNLRLKTESALTRVIGVVCGLLLDHHVGWWEPVWVGV